VPTKFSDGEKLTREDHETLVREWGEVVKRFFEELARLQSRLGLPQSWLYVVEPQDNRWKREKLFSPHLHCVFLNRWDKDKPSRRQGFGKGDYSITEIHTDELWRRTLSNLLGKSVEVGAAATIEKIKEKKGLGSYLVKVRKIASYCSKGSSSIKEMNEAGINLVRSWAGCDERTRHDVNRSITKIRSTMSAIDLKIALNDHGGERDLIAGWWDCKIEGLPWFACSMFRVARSTDAAFLLDVLRTLVDDGLHNPEDCDTL
jgi:hypothetical protein